MSLVLDNESLSDDVFQVFHEMVKAVTFRRVDTGWHHHYNHLNNQRLKSNCFGIPMTIIIFIESF